LPYAFHPTEHREIWVYVFSLSLVYALKDKLKKEKKHKDEVTGEWRKLHNEALHNLYSFPDIIRQVKSRRMRWAGHVARMGEERKLYKVLVG
jgi:hypothetical protein